MYLYLHTHINLFTLTYIDPQSTWQQIHQLYITLKHICRFWETVTRTWLWFSSLFIFCADTQLWFTVGCSILGVTVTLVQQLGDEDDPVDRRPHFSGAKC